MENIKCDSTTHFTGCKCHEYRRNYKVNSLVRENKRLRNSLIHLINVMVEDHFSKSSRSDGKAFKDIWNDSMKLGNATSQNMLHVDKKTSWECSNCGYLNSVKNGPCFGCKLSSPPRKEVEDE